jgi:hypothetical protein
MKMKRVPSDPTLQTRRDNDRFSLEYERSEGRKLIRRIVSYKKKRIYEWEQTSLIVRIFMSLPVEESSRIFCNISEDSLQVGSIREGVHYCTWFFNSVTGGEVDILNSYWKNGDGIEIVLTKACPGTSWAIALEDDRFDKITIMRPRPPRSQSARHFRSERNIQQQEKAMCSQRSNRPRPPRSQSARDVHSERNTQQCEKSICLKRCNSSSSVTKDPKKMPVARPERRCQKGEKQKMIQRELAVVDRRTKSSRDIQIPREISFEKAPHRPYHSSRGLSSGRETVKQPSENLNALKVTPHQRHAKSRDEHENSG